VRRPLAGFLVLLAAALFAMDSAALDNIANQQVTFTSSDGSVLAGTLTLPNNVAGKLPALVLIQGSGPTDRDGNQPPALRTDLLRQFAEALALQGFATLRYDKRGMHANAGGRPISAGDYPAYFDWVRFVDDAYAAYAFLRAQPMVEMTKTGLLGHSEGGLIALDLANRLVAAEAPRFLVLASTYGRPVDVVLREQLQRLLGEQKASQAQRKFFLDANDRITATIRDTGKVPGDVPAGLVGLYPSYIGAFWQAQMKLDPAALAAKYPGPVMILQGEADIQISAERDALALDRALRQRESDDHTLILLPKGSHNLKTLQTDKDPGFEGEIDPAVLAQMAEWIRGRLDR
jgi:dienelactone hydrolase